MGQSQASRAIHQYFQDGDASRMLFPQERELMCRQCGRFRQHRQYRNAYKAAGMWWQSYRCSICKHKQNTSHSIPR